MSNDPSLKPSFAWYNPKRLYNEVMSRFISSKPTDDVLVPDPEPAIADTEVENPPSIPVVVSLRNECLILLSLLMDRKM